MAGDGLWYRTPMMGGQEREWKAKRKAKRSRNKKKKRKKAKNLKKKTKKNESDWRVDEELRGKAKRMKKKMKKNVENEEEEEEEEKGEWRKKKRKNESPMNEWQKWNERRRSASPWLRSGRIRSSISDFFFFVTSIKRWLNSIFSWLSSSSTGCHFVALEHYWVSPSFLRSY